MDKIPDLYHYCKFSTFIEKILPNFQLKLGLLKNTNDPRETRDFIINTITYYEGPFINKSELNNSIKKGCKVVCFSSDSSPYSGYEYSRMWALYGENHKGVCIKINGKKFIEKNRELVHYIKPINYIRLHVEEPIPHPVFDRREVDIQGIDKSIDDFRHYYIDHLFFTKFEEWQSEHEIRLLYFSSTEVDEFCSIKDCIDMIYLGVDFNMVYLPSIQRFLPLKLINKLEFVDVRLEAHTIN